MRQVRAEPGDSLWSIAERFHGDVDLSRYVDALVDLNGGAGHRRRAARAPALSRGRSHYPRPVHCPVCHADDTKVVDSRLAEEGAAVRRRRHCLSCAHRFTTFERVDEVPLVVVKGDGRTQPFDRRRSSPASWPRPRAATSTPSVVEQIAESIEDAVRLQGSEVTSAQIGLAVLDRLRTIDEVAYLRFASVYKNFDAAADFHREIELLTKARRRPESGRASSGCRGTTSSSSRGGRARTGPASAWAPVTAGRRRRRRGPARW